MAKALYKGYSSFEFQKNKSFEIVDVELVKLDLLNHIFTQRGSRPMMPTYGTQIPQLVFEPLDSDLITILEEELRDVFDSDPRVEILSLVIKPSVDQNQVLVDAELNYVELNIVDDFELNIKFEA